ncbi:exported hypothetical protein [Candidatus Sulfotelmatobacter kueseliae]|uniref:Uncharacterized protein n=1 Tax=Candidatus Sulfotelmatobacter kueseliae TaxID=2042962 RepID=A0A2U3KFA5_9BACT|nr:exported hypothetical protein [Candidatus Sulfotelmatobacter kueseliae]
MMKQPRHLYLIFLSTLWLLCSLWPLHALSQESLNLGAMVAPHPYIRFSSTLLNEEGKPLAGLHLLTFYIHDTGDRRGNPLWTEALPVQSDENGNYTVDLMTSASAGVAEAFDAHPLLYVSTSIPASSSYSRAQAITTIPQAIYQDCNLDGESCSGLAGDTATSQLDKIAAANFYVVLNYSVFWGTEKELLAYAAHANSHNLKIMWTFNDPDFAKYSGKSGKYLINDYSEISATCGCSTNKGFLQYLVNLVKDLPATYGYSIGDEPTPNTASYVQNLYNIIRAVDPHHPQMVNATWDDATNPSLTNLRKYLDPFRFADILGADYYPIGTGAPASDTATAASDVHTIATTYGKSAEIALQAFNWNQYPGSGVCSGSQCTYPTTRQLQTMLHDAASDAKPKIIFWYDYWDTVNAGQWSDFVRTVNPQHPCRR